MWIRVIPYLTGAICVLGGSLLLSCGWIGQERVDFLTDIQPLLQERCLACHGGVRKKSGLSLLSKLDATGKTDSGKPAIVVGDAGASQLIRRVKESDPERRMPFRDEPLSSSEVRLLEYWIDQGAPWPAHWAYQPPEMNGVPQVEDEGWVRNGIDSFVLSRLENEGLRPAGEADCATLLRRLSLDLTGLPPAPNEVDGFCRDTSPDAYSRQVTRLLDSPHFGERWASMWLDLARFADTKGYEKDPHRTIWKYRDWVIRAFNQDMPFNQFTIEQLAGDLLPDPKTEQLIATAFNRNTMTNTEGGTSDEEFRLAAVIDRVNTTMEAWQGTTMNCVQCHDHPYDAFRHEEYYQLLAFFNNTLDSDRADEEPTLPVFDDPARAREAEQLMGQLGELEAELESRAGNPETLQGMRDWVEEARRQLMSSEGRTLVGLKEIPGESEIEEIIKTPDEKRTPDERWRLIKYYLSVAPELDSLRKRISGKEEAIESLKPVRIPIMQELPPEHKRITRVFERGNWLTQRRAVEADVPESLGQLSPEVPRNRLGLAQWLVSRENPLTARVTVNRFWYQIFGRGLVVTLEDFGTRGEPPSHPELLDWLAIQFMTRHQWSVKALLGQIVESATYRQSSHVSPDDLARDPDNRWLSRGSRYRLSAEAVRDQALAVGGILAEKMFGPSVMPLQPPGIWNSPYGEGDKWIVSQGDDRYRRALYTYWKRTSPYPSMETFDRANGEVSVSRRIRTNTPLQALVTLNDPVFIEAARGLAGRMQSFDGAKLEALERGYRTALFKAPDRDTLNDLVLLYESALEHFEAEPNEANRLLGRADDRPAEPERAALTVVGNAIMNLDEFLTRN